MVSTFHDFDPANAQNQLEHLLGEIKRLITGRTTVSLNIDETLLNMTFIADDFQLSVIYTEGGTTV